MTAKKNAINISIAMIFASLLMILFCWPGKDQSGIRELLYVLSSGIFGSSFATLWVFIYEYHKEKNQLLRSIFNESVSIFENSPFIWLDRFGFFDPEIKAYMEHKYYMPPVDAETAANMEKKERCLYELCRFVDETLDIGYAKLKLICDLPEEIDFWSDSFRRTQKYRDVIIQKISLPVYEVFISAPAMENGYLFRYFKGFKLNLEYSADQIYDFVCELDKALHNPNGEMKKYAWQNKNVNLREHMHETLWIFRDGFFSPELPRARRHEALRAFLKDTPYKYVR